MDDEELVELGRAIKTLARRTQLVIGRNTQIELLPPTETEVLAHVIHHPGCRVQDVADALLFAPANASAVVSRLERRGLVEKRPDEGDRRAVRLYPSPVADDERARLDRSSGVVYDAVQQHLSPAELQLLREVIPVLWKMGDLVVERNADPGSRKDIRA